MKRDISECWRLSALTCFSTVLLLCLAPADSRAAGERSLAKCQQAIGREIGKYVATRKKAVEKCLAKIAKERLTVPGADPATGARACQKAFRKIINGERPQKALEWRARDKIGKQCEPAHPKFRGDHLTGDILGGGIQAVTAESIEALPQMVTPCIHFGGSGGFSGLSDWIDCLMAMANRQAAQQLHMTYPNADRWLREVRPHILGLGLGNPYSDAAAALDSMRRWVDNGDGTVSDHVTGLMWEQKDDGGGVHDYRNLYTWSSGGSDPDGTAFTTFLATLNDGATGVGSCTLGANVSFAGYCDWRMPTAAEWITILLEPFPCTLGAPCLDTDVFGPSASGAWSSTSSLSDVSMAWSVGTSTGELTTNSKAGGFSLRAVRGGL